MAVQSALVAQVVGQAWVRGANGQPTPVSAGDRISINTEIITADNSSVMLEIEGMNPIFIGANRVFLLSADVIDGDLDPGEESLSGLDDPGLDALARLLNSGGDPFTVLDPTSALLETDRSDLYRLDSYSANTNARSLSAVIRLLSTVESTLDIDRSFNWSDQAQPLVPEFPHSIRGSSMISDRPAGMVGSGPGTGGLLPATPSTLVPPSVSPSPIAPAPVPPVGPTTPPNDVPMSRGGSVLGTEDTAFKFGWGNFNVSDASAPGTHGIVITGLPANGVLQYSADGSTWTQVTLTNGQFQISRSDIEAGKLRFVPGLNESSGGAGSGVGNNQATYAEITFKPTDGQYQGESVKLVINVTPVADAPVVAVQLGDVAEVRNSTSTYTFGNGIVFSVAGGVYSAANIDGKLAIPPFPSSTGGNINTNNVTQGKTDIIALIGNFDRLVQGHGGNGTWQNLNGINGEDRDYLYLSKSSDRYSLTNVNVHGGSIDAQLRDLDTGLTINLNNIKGIIYGDGSSYNIPGMQHQVIIDSYDLVQMHVSAALTDLDGSETLSGITLSGIPAGVTVDGAVKLANGNWFIANAHGADALSLQVTLKVPNGTNLFTVSASATATENGTSASTATTEVRVIVDTAAEASILIDRVTADNVINASEAGGVVMVTGIVGGVAKFGDIVTVTVGGQMFTGTVQADRTWSVGVTGSVLAGNSSVSASVAATNGAGNTVTVVDGRAYTVDVDAPELTISVSAITSDNVVNAVESGAATIAVTGTIATEAGAATTVTITVNGVAYTATVDAATGTWTADVATADLVADTTVLVSATATDAAGNSTPATASHDYEVDLEAPALTVSVDDITSDNVVNAVESGAATIAVTGTIATEAGAATTVTITVNGVAYTATVDAATGTWTADVATADLVADTTVLVSATATDAAGNSTPATASHDYEVDLEAPAPTLTINPVASDNYLDHSEAAGDITLTGQVSGEINGTTLITITIGDNTYTATIVNGNEWSVTVPGSVLAEHTQVQATVTTTDAAGNTGSGNAAQRYDVQPSNEVPASAGGAVTGTEDTPIAFTWSDFNVTDDSPSAEQGIVITGLPAHGVLQFNADPSTPGSSWTAIDLVNGQYQVSRADIEAGKLRFLPADNESGSDAYGGSGVGDQQADYAHIVFKPTDGASTGNEATLVIDIAPVADAPDVSVSLSRTETETDGGPGAGSAVTQVNGGSGSPNGFDVQDGKIVAIGSNVRLWLTEGDTVPQGVSPDQIRYYAQGNNGGDSAYADIFVVHSQSGWFYRQSDWPADRKELRKLDSVGGNRESNDVGDKDYIFVQQQDGYSYTPSNSTNNNNNTHVNTLDGVRIGYTGPNGAGTLTRQAGNNLEGVIFGNGQPPHLADINGTTIQPAPAVPSIEVSYEIAVAAAVTDTDGSEFLGNLILTGIPAGSTVAVVGSLPNGLSLVQAGGNWELRWNGGVGNSDRQQVNVTLKVTNVPEGVDFTGVTVHVDAYEVNGSAASSSDSAILEPQDGSGPTNPGETPPEYVYSEESLLVNGDFSQFANQTQWWSGNIDQGFKAWAHTGPFLDHKWLMTDRTYVGAWNNDARDITLSQNVSGVNGGTRLQLDIAWNNPNNGIIGDPWNTPKDTGNTMRLEISFAGIVYAVITTPSAGTAVGDSWFASVTAMNGASVNIDRIETWSYDYSTNNGNNDFRPPNLDGFHTLQITLPPDVAGSGQLKLHWDPQSEGGQFTDDVMVANVQMHAVDMDVTGFSLLSTSDMDHSGIEGAYALDDAQIIHAQDAVQNPLTGTSEMLGTAGDDVFTWRLADADALDEVALIKDFGLGNGDGRGSDVLDLRDLLVGENHGDLTDYLHIAGSVDESGVTSTVISVQTHGSLGADGSGYNYQIKLEDVDLAGSLTDQAQLIQNLINDGKLKVDQ